MIHIQSSAFIACRETSVQSYFTFHSKHVLGQYTSKHSQCLSISVCKEHVENVSSISIEALHWLYVQYWEPVWLKHSRSAGQNESELTVFLRPEWLICSLLFITGLILELSAVTKNSWCTININEAHPRQHTSAFKGSRTERTARYLNAQVTRAQWGYLGQSCGIKNK